MPVDVLRENDNYVEALQTATHSADFGLDNLPALLVQVIAENRWQARWVRALKHEVSFATFAEFATEKTPAGLGTSVDMLKRMCRDVPEALDALDRAVQGKHGGDHGNQYTGGKSDIIRLAKPQHGTSADYALRKLRSDRSDLHARVLAGELSPHAAMVEAGFRRRTFSIPATDPEKAAASIRRNMRPEDIRVLIEHLEGF